MSDVHASIAANDDAIRTSGFRELISRYDDPDVIYRLAEARIGAYLPDDEVQRVKLLTAWLDGFTTAARTYATER
jgi:hypothetical protein